MIVDTPTGPAIRINAWCVIPTCWITRARLQRGFKNGDPVTAHPILTLCVAGRSAVDIDEEPYLSELAALYGLDGALEALKEELMAS